jgi:hypothetical protein
MTAQDVSARRLADTAPARFVPRKRNQLAGKIVDFAGP